MMPLQAGDLTLANGQALGDLTPVIGQSVSQQTLAYSMLAMSAANEVYNIGLSLDKYGPNTTPVVEGAALSANGDQVFVGGIAQPYAVQSGFVWHNPQSEPANGFKGGVLVNSNSNTVVVAIAGMDGFTNGQDQASGVVFNGSNQFNSYKGDPNPSSSGSLSIRQYILQEFAAGRFNTDTKMILATQSMGTAIGTMVLADLVSDTEGSLGYAIRRLPNGQTFNSANILLVGGNGLGVPDEVLQQSTGLTNQELANSGAGRIYLVDGNVGETGKGDIVSGISGYALKPGDGVIELRGGEGGSVSGYHSMHASIFPGLQNLINNPTDAIVRSHVPLDVMTAVTITRFVGSLGSDGTPLSSEEGYLRTALGGSTALALSLPGQSGRLLALAIGEMTESPTLGTILGNLAEIAMKVVFLGNPAGFVTTILKGLALTKVVGLVTDPSPTTTIVDGNFVVDYGNVVLTMSQSDGTYAYSITNDNNTTTAYGRHLDSSGQYFDTYVVVDNTTGNILESSVASVPPDYGYEYETILGLKDGTAGTVERQSLGFYTEQEVASRLGQLGLADPTQFMTDGFAAAGAQNAGLNDLQVEIGGVKFVWNNNWADLNLTRGAGWSAVGNGAVDSLGAPYCVAPLLNQSILYTGSAQNRLSPLVLDLDGDGVAADLTHAYTGGRVFFDIDGDGFAERIGWVKADDGLLARDVNGNGVIDDITELYGDDKMPAFQKLRLLDVNGDSRIDAADAAYADLRVWQDASQDGITQQGELKTLASLGIQSISTNDHTDSRWANENYISSSTTYTRLENAIAVEREIADVHFLNDNANTWLLGAHSQVYGSDVQIDLEAILLPLSRGYGSLPSLHLAMSTNPELKRMVRELAYLPIDRLGEAVSKVNEILLEWAGVRDHDPAGHANGDGPRIDGRKVDFIEKFTGLTWAQRGVTAMVGEDASIGIKKTWNGIEAAMLQRLLAQGALHAVMPNASYDFATDKIILNESLSAIVTRASSLAPTTADAAREFWTQLGGILIGGKEELGTTVAAINTAVSAAAGQPLYLGEHMVAPSNFGDPDWGLYTGNGTANEELVGMIFQGDAQANTLGGTGAGEYFFGGRLDVCARDQRKMKSRRWRDGERRNVEIKTGKGRELECFLRLIVLHGNESLRQR